MSRALCIDIHTYTSPLPAGRIKPAKSQQILLKLRSKVLPIHHERTARTVKVGTSSRLLKKSLALPFWT